MRNEELIQDAVKQVRLTQNSIERNLERGNVDNLKELAKQLQRQADTLAQYVRDL